MYLNAFDLRRSVTTAMGQLKGNSFYIGMAAAALFTVFAGFAPTFYLATPLHSSKHISLLLALHGTLFTLWIILFLIQSLTAAREKPRVHAVVGWLSCVVAVTMLVVSVPVILGQSQKAHSRELAALFLALNSFNLVAFAAVLSFGIILRKKREWHPRLMTAATLTLLGPAIIRIIHQLPLHLPPTTSLYLTFLLTDLFFVACFIRDLIAIRRVHAAFLSAFLLHFASQIGVPAVSHYGWWVQLTARTIGRS